MDVGWKCHVAKVNRPCSGVASYKKVYDWPTTPLISRTLTVYGRPSRTPRSEKREKKIEENRRREKSLHLGEFPELLEIPTRAREGNRIYRIHSVYIILMIYNHLSERKMVETRDADAILFNIIYRRFVETITAILITLASIIFFVQKFTDADSFRTIKDRAREKCDILEKLTIQKSRRRSNASQEKSRYASLEKFLGTIKNLSIFHRSN